MITWIGEPRVKTEGARTTIEQDFRIDGTRAWDAWTVEASPDADGVRLSGRGEGALDFPSHVVPLLLEAIARVQRSSSLAVS